MARSTVRHDAAADAAVNAARTETLYDLDGDPIAVPGDRVEKFLRQGYTREHQDVPTLASEVAALSKALPETWRAYVDACAAAGSVDNAAQDTARAALDELATACNRLHLALHRAYPSSQED